jgi:ubiquinone/menaquinone biosynthesis C-methylase UbiE
MLVSAQEGYRQWAATYDASPNPIVALEARYLSEWLRGARGKRVIDVGCGTGRWIERVGGVGVDLSREMLAQCSAAGRVAQADALRLPFASQVADVVLCTLSLGYLWPARAALEEMMRVARSGGAVIVTDVHPQAIRCGWKHSFRDGQGVYEIENRPYSLEDLPREGLEDVKELFFGEPERPIFERAGKLEFFEESCRIPAVWMLKWRVQ